MEKTELNSGRKNAESGRHHGAARIRHAESFPVGHCHVAKYGLNQDVRVSQSEAKANGSSGDLINTISVWLFQG